MLDGVVLNRELCKKVVWDKAIWDIVVLARVLSDGVDLESEVLD